MASKVILEGNESLEEIQGLIKELKVVEDELISRTGRRDESGTTLTNPVTKHCEPDKLLNDNELQEFEAFSFSPDLDRSVLAVPNVNPKLVEYPVDFVNVVQLDSNLLAIKHNLLNYVKAVINEDSLSKFFFKNDSPPTTRSSAEETIDQSRVPPRRKDSYTIHRVAKPSPTKYMDDNDHDMLYPSPEHLRHPRNYTSTPIRGNEVDKSYSTNTYSKKSSPFAPFTSRQPSNSPFMKNGNLSHEALNGVTTKNDNANISNSQRTLTRPPRASTTQHTNGVEHSLGQDLDNENRAKSHNLSMEEIQYMARLQQESLLSSGGPELRKNSQDWVDPMNKSIEEDDASGSGNGAWSNDTYSVSVSNPPSETSSGISSPPAGSLEDVQVEPLRRSMPNLTPRNLSLAPMYSGNLQRDAYYNSDLRLSQNRSRNRAVRSPNTAMETAFIGDGQHEINYNSPTESGYMEPLKKALARADTYLQSEGMTITDDSGNSMNRYATYQLPKHSAQKSLGNRSRIPAPRNSFGYNCGSPSSGSANFESQMDPGGRDTVTPAGGAVSARLSYSSSIPQGQGQGRHPRSAGHR